MTTKRKSTTKKKTTPRKRTKLSGVRGGKNNINKSDIVDFTAKKAGLTQKDTKAVIDAFMETIKQTTESEGHVTLAKFGTFKQTKRKGYTKKASAKQKKIFGSATIKVPATKKLTFTASKS